MTFVRILVGACLLVFLQSQVIAESKKSIPKEPSTPTLPTVPDRKKDTPPVVDFPSKKPTSMKRKAATKACLDSCKERFIRKREYDACKFKCSTQLQ
jgi:hypothetical protein